MCVYSVFTITLSWAAMFTGLYCFQAAPDTQQLPGRAGNGAIHGALLGRQRNGTGQAGPAPAPGWHDSRGLSVPGRG